MSRLALQPIAVPEKTEVVLAEGRIKAKGPVGEASWCLPKGISVHREEEKIWVRQEEKAQIEAKAMLGTAWSLIRSMIVGVSQGFDVRLQLVGVGYRAQVKGQSLALELGFSHPVEYPVPQGIKVEMPSPTEIVLKGADKQKVGQVASEIRRFRPPEPYKGKGIRFAGEVVLLKETKKK